ncbi:MAG: PLP-dependent transferase [Chthonomonas sp.]|nr:PLP-dependent transferase [Chthonomonas sp.]
MEFASKPIRVGQKPESAFKSVIFPIYQSSTFAWDDLESTPDLEYTRVQNPTRRALESVIAALENAEFCTCFSSGMAAVMATFSLLKQGDHLLIASDIYGGTHRLGVAHLPNLGIDVSFYDASNPDSMREAATDRTRMVIFESPTNPTMQVMDIAANVLVAKSLGLLVVFDNTFASPALQTPLEFEVDLVLHSTTKYIGGHSDVVGGAVATKDPQLAEQIFEFNKNVGCNPSPFDCWLTLRGVKTLALRMERHCKNAAEIARYLEAHPRIRQVYYPGLESNPGHTLAKVQMNGFGGMLSFDLDGSEEQARALAKDLSFFILAESLGGVESLIGYPKLMSHAGMTEEERLARRITPTLLRLSVGIEDSRDLIADLEQALKKLG